MLLVVWDYKRDLVVNNYVFVVIMELKFNGSMYSSIDKITEHCTALTDVLNLSLSLRCDVKSESIAIFNPDFLECAQRLCLAVL